jgi:phospholipid-transporting ATPase
MRTGSLKDVKWKEVKVGDLLQVRDDEDIPADLVCVGCSHPDNVCFIKTTNLDGAWPQKLLVCQLLDSVPH